METSSVCVSSGFCHTEILFFTMSITLIDYFASGDPAMTSFFEQTWFLWWIAAIVIILRWHHLALNGPSDDSPTLGSGHQIAHSELFGD